MNLDSDYEEPTFTDISNSEYSGDEEDWGLKIGRKKNTVKKCIKNSSSVVVDIFDGTKYAYKTDLTFTEPKSDRRRF